ncbi:MAG: hypothetical protein EOO89_28220, partial [Pedobacter sp.]
MRIKFTYSGWLTAMLCLLFSISNAQDDQVFGADNKVWNPAISYTPTDFSRILVEVNGRILHVKHGSNGGTTITRYYDDGSIDPGYGNGGSVNIPAETGVFEPKDAVLTNGAGVIIVGVARVGASGYGVGVIKLTSNGTFDPNFYGGGKQVVYINNSNLNVNAVALQPDGKIIVLATTFLNTGESGPAVIRLSPDGYGDTSFSGDGLMVYPSSASTWSGVDLTSQPDGKIVFLAESRGVYQNGIISQNHTDFAFARLNADGSVDNSFGNSGQQIVGVSGVNEHPSNVGIDITSDKIVAFGHQEVVGDPNNTKFLSVKLLPNGTPDPGYGGTGIGIAYYNENMQAVSRDMIVQTNGKVFASGRVLCGSNCGSTGSTD